MAARKKCLVDTSTLIALFRKNEDAKFALETLKAGHTYICDITLLEILAGGNTIEKRERALHSLEAYRLLNSNIKVSEKSIQLMKRYCIQRIGQPVLKLADCLIAAFAIYHKMELLTFNKKDFDFLHGIAIHPLSK
ncbi:MAG: PIN domain-containing protein [Chitinophagaceae bacterium]|jgi:predicted nucleic acid-binding protein|nr:PIN domain-containing protein [Chitinophagaceae bacterium]